MSAPSNGVALMLPSIFGYKRWLVGLPVGRHPLPDAATLMLAARGGLAGRRLFPECRDLPTADDSRASRLRTVAPSRAERSLVAGIALPALQLRRSLERQHPASFGSALEGPMPFL